MNGYLILILKWLINMALAYGMYTTTHNTYLPIAFIYIMVWQDIYASLIGGVIKLQEAQSLCVSILMNKELNKLEGE